jgi:hypothetical protein
MCSLGRTLFRKGEKRTLTFQPISAQLSPANPNSSGALKAIGMRYPHSADRSALKENTISPGLNSRMVS